MYVYNILIIISHSEHYCMCIIIVCNIKLHVTMYVCLNILISNQANLCRKISKDLCLNYKNLLLFPEFTIVKNNIIKYYFICL